MARSRYEFIKIEMRLFRDRRFLMLNDFEKLLYITLIALAKQTNNRVPKDIAFIRAWLNTKNSPRCVRDAIKNIVRTFEDVCQNGYYISFKKWDERYDYCGVEKEKEVEKEKDVFLNKTTLPELRASKQTLKEKMNFK